MKKIISSIIIIVSLISFLTSWFYVNQGHSEFSLIPFLPLTYLFIYIVYFRKIIFSGSSITAVIFSIIAFFRYVIIPLMVVFTPKYGISYMIVKDEIYYHYAFLLMIYELVIISLVIYFYNRFKSKKKIEYSKKTSSIKITGAKPFYIAFLVLVIVTYLLYPQANTLLSFLSIDNSADSRINEDLGFNLMVVRQILITGTIILYVLIVEYLYRLYIEKRSVIYVNLAIIMTFLQISIIVGERRSVQIYTTFVTLYILLKLFKNYKKRILTLVLTGASIVLIGMSIYKFFYAFSYDSYWEAIINNQGGTSLVSIANYLETYFKGPQNIAMTVQFAAEFNLSFINIFFDVFRSIIGLSFLVTNMDYSTTVALFNGYIYNREVTTGHIMSSIGYGYLYFGFILAPIFTIIATFFTLLIEDAFKKATSLELTYLLGYIYIRFIIGIFTSITALLNNMSLMLISLGFIYLLSRLVYISFNKDNLVYKTNKIF